MKVRALVAKTDGIPGRDNRALAPGSIIPSTVPVTEEFDHTRVIGRATLSVEGWDVWADIDIMSKYEDAVIGKFPCLGYRSTDSSINMTHSTDLAADVITVGICARGNADPRIPAIQ